MKSNKVKIIGISLAVFIAVVGALFYFASTKLNPEEIRKMAIEQTQKVFPKSEVALDKVDIDWGLNFKINLEKFSIKALQGSEKIEMMSVDQLVIKVPIWAIITGAGVVEVKLDAPLMNYQEFQEGNNWTYALGDKKQDKALEKENTTDGKSTSANGPLAFFAKSKINVKMSDIAVKYKLRDNSNGNIKVSKFLIKGLNFESSTAFEIASTAQFVMKDNSKVSFDTIAIGEINIADLLKNGSVSSLVIVKVNNISKTGLEWKFPEITTNVDMLLKKDGEVSGKIATSFESQNKITANFKMTKQIEISDINVEIILKDVAAIMGLDKTIDLSRSKLLSKGQVIYSEDKKILANMSFSITPGIGYSKEGITATTSVSGEFKEKDISVKVKTDLLDGVISTIVAGEFNPNDKFDMTKLKPFEIKVTATGLKVAEKLIRSKLWDKKPEAEKANDDDEDTTSSKGSKVAASKPPVGLPPSNVQVEWSNVNVGGEDFSGKGRIITGINSIAIDNLNFKFSKGLGKLSQKMTLGKKSSESNFNFEMNGLNLNSFKSFLPPFVENFSGIFTGKVNGSATMFNQVGKAPLFDVNVIADAKNGELKKLNISEYINPMLANIPVVKDQVKDKQIKINGDFETFTMKGRFTNNVYNLSSFNFVGLNKKVEISGNGEIFPALGSGKDSLMEVNYTDNTGKISEILVKNIGTKVLPMKLSGPGFALKPDYQYTLSKVAKGAIKTKGAEAVKDIINKNIDKVIPAAAKEKVEGLLNGLFKKR